MAKVISQETFDEAFKDNLELAEGSVDEAREETIQQFTKMGVNLGMCGMKSSFLCCSLFQCSFFSR